LSSGNSAFLAGKAIAIQELRLCASEYLSHGKYINIIYGACLFARNWVGVDLEYFGTI